MYPDTGMADQLETMWRDRGRRYSIADAELVEAAKPMYRYHCRQVLETTDAHAEKLGLRLSSLGWRSNTVMYVQILTDITSNARMTWSWSA